MFAFCSNCFVKSFFFLIREENQDVKKLSRKILATICVIYQRDKVKKKNTPLKEVQEEQNIFIAIRRKLHRNVSSRFKNLETPS